MSTTTASVIATVQDPKDTKNVYFRTGGYLMSRPILTGKDAKKTFDKVPEIDFTHCFSPNLKDRQAIAKEVAQACEEVGFFYAVNPPVSHEKMDAVMAAYKKFFDLPQDELMKLHVDNSQGVKGYLPFTFSNGSDSRAAYSIGRDYTNPEQHFINVAPPGTVSLNQFPDDVFPEFRKTVYEYYHEVFRFSRKLQEIFALALGLEESAFDDLFRYPLCDLTLQYYPVQDPNEQSPIAPHADYGGFTVLLQDNSGGLEVLNANGIWVPAPPKEHCYVINTGSYLEVLSNGRFPATVHRAFGNAKASRYSLPFFLHPDPSKTIAPIPALLKARGEEAKFEPQVIGKRQIRGLMANRPHHPFFQRLEEMGWDKEELTFDLMLMPMDKIRALEKGPACV